MCSRYGSTCTSNQGDPASGLRPAAAPAGDLGRARTADRPVQSYNYRVCLTDHEANKLPLTPPADYDPADYELLARWIESRAGAGRKAHTLELLQI